MSTHVHEAADIVVDRHTFPTSGGTIGWSAFCRTNDGWTYPARVRPGQLNPDPCSSMHEVERASAVHEASHDGACVACSSDCPECSQGKHQNCDTTAWSALLDAPTVCACWVGGHQ